MIQLASRLLPNGPARVAQAVGQVHSSLRDALLGWLTGLIFGQPVLVPAPAVRRPHPSRRRR